MFDIGMQEIIVIIIVALLVFGPKRLPELSRTIGKGIADLRRAVEEAKYQVDRELRAEEEEILYKVEIPEKGEDNIEKSEADSSSESSKK
ncbi:MAG: Sec-independent protein translocase protein TatB [Thermodesulfovibrionales bacterium]|nr:Sec-independent protein translocase protein TatB [Thermodesulfovibrionales bacterium]